MFGVSFLAYLGSALYLFIRVGEAYQCYVNRLEWVKIMCYPNIYSHLRDLAYLERLFLFFLGEGLLRPVPGT